MLDELVESLRKKHIQ
jgi:hypothetical protein